MGFPRQECRSGLPFPPPGALQSPGIKSMSPALVGGFSTTESPDTGSKYYNFSKAVYLSESINSYQLGMSSLTFSFISFLWTFFDCVLMKFLSYFHALLLGSAVILPKGAHLLIFWELFLAMIRFSSRFQTMHTLLHSLVPYSVLYNIQYLCTIFICQAGQKPLFIPVNTMWIEFPRRGIPANLWGIQTANLWGIQS